MWYSVYFQLRDRNPEIHPLISIKQTKEEQQTPPKPQTNKWKNPSTQVFLYVFLSLTGVLFVLSGCCLDGLKYCFEAAQAEDKMEWGGILCVLGSN